MRKRPSTILLSGLLAALPCLAAACGDQPAAAKASAPSGADSPDALGRERVAELVAKATASQGDFQTEMRREVPLPSHRRLLSYLPAEIPDFPYVALESELKADQGRAMARGRYQLSKAHYRGGIELKVTYFGKEMFNGPKKYFDAGIGDRSEIAGFSARTEKEGTRGDEEFEVQVRISPEVYVSASGPGSSELIRGAAEAVDLAGLAKAVESGLIFEQTREDRLEEEILSRSEIEALIPPTLGPQELASVNSQAQLEEAPMHSRATGTFGQGQWTLIDYGDAEVAAAVELKPREDQGFAMHIMRRDDEIQEAELEVADGRGAWAWLEPVEHQPGVLTLRAVRGRFVLEYMGPFLPEAEVAANLPEALRAELEKVNRQMGVGVFDSIEDQRDAALAAFEALELEI